MSTHARVAALQTLIEPIVTGLELELWGVEYMPQGDKSLLRIYIDHPDGIMIDQCEAVSRQVSALFDVEDPIPNEYRLEVSSPGIERPLFHLGQYRLYIGELVQIKLREAFEGRKKFKGILVGIEEETDVVVRVDNEELLLPMTSIDKAYALLKV